MNNIVTKIEWLVGNLEELKNNAVECRVHHKKTQLNMIFLNAAIRHFTDILKESHCLECGKAQLMHDLPALSHLKKAISGR